MEDIFISYSREDLGRAKQIVEALRPHGWDIWWDLESLRAGQPFNQAIQEALGRVKCVVVLWSKASVESRYVEAEAYWAWQNKKLVSVLLDSRLELRVPFNTTHSESLIGWSGGTSGEQYKKLVSDLSKVIGAPVEIETRQKEDSKTAQTGVGTGLASFACAYCGASGRNPYALTPCPVCKGRGEVKMPIVDRMQCRYCGGKGKDPFALLPCKVCKGFGYVDR